MVTVALALCALLLTAVAVMTTALLGTVVGAV